MGPRTFGEGTIEPKLIATDPRLISAHHDTRNDSANGSFDAFLLNGKNDKLKIEIKAIRAVSAKVGQFDSRSLIERAMYIEDLSPKTGIRFDWNFQQIKPDIPDFFILIAVFANGTDQWVMSSADIRSNRYFSDKQHRGNIGEGQLHFNQNNLSEFDDFEVPNISNLANTILDYQKLHTTSHDVSR